MRPDQAAVAALAEAARAGRAPCRAAVCLRDGDAALSHIQQRSLSAWLEPPTAAGAPTDAELRSDYARRNRLVASEAAAELQELQRRTASAAASKPDSQNPRELCEMSGNPQLAPSLLSAAPLPPRVQVPMPGKLATIDPQGFYDAHAGLCDKCAASPPEPCYGPSMARLAGGIDWPWLGGIPPTASHDPIYDEALANATRKLLDLGIIFEPSDPSSIRHFSSVYMAEKLEVHLNTEELAACETGGPAAAHDVAAAKAGAFNASYEASLRRTGWEPGAQPPPARAVSAAWDAAAKCLGPTKGRVVIDMGSLTPCFQPSRLRYGTVRSFTDGLEPGDWQIKLDMEKGFLQLPLTAIASLYTGFKVHLGDRVVTFCFGRMPMGAHPSPHLFSCFSAEAKRQMVRMMSPTPGACLLSGKLTYVDDFLAAARAKANAAAALTCLRITLGRMGAAVSEPKTSLDPAQTQVNLGVRVDTSTPEGVTISLPLDKVVKTLSLAMVVAHAAASALPIPERILGSLGGAVNWWATVDTDITCHTPRLARWAHAGHGRWAQWRSGTHKWGPEAAAYVKELTWLIDQARTGRLLCSRTQSAASTLARPCAVFSIDAGPDAICISSEMGTLRVYLPNCGGLLIAIMELLAAVIIFQEYGHLLEGMLVDVASDALGACEWAMSRRSWRGEANDLFKLLGAATHKLNVAYIQRWLTRWHNFRSDRGAALPLAQIPAAIAMGMAAETTYAGLPCAFLKPLASACYPSIVFDIEAWSKVNARK